MELELGLALPVSAHFPNKSSLDLNSTTACAAFLEQPQVMKNGGMPIEFKNLMICSQKRSFDEAFDREKWEDDDDDDDHDRDHDGKTLSLLVWHGRRPNHQDDDNDGGRREGQRKKPFNADAMKDEMVETQIAGWPPLKSWRKKLHHQARGGHRYRFGDDHQRACAANTMGPRNSVFVKVKMEGVIIGRKIDSTLFNSYQALTNTLLNMFAKYRKGDDEDEPYILSYLDEEGDWRLAGDVPWRTFIASVRRIEILKRGSK